MKIDREKVEKILDAVCTVCMNCVEDTLNNSNICESCPVRKLWGSLEYDEVENRKAEW